MRTPARASSIRTALALVSVAVTSMVAIAFLIPLAVIVRDVARDRAFTSAQLAGAAIDPVLAVTTDRATLERAIATTPAGAAGQLAVYLTAAPPVGDGTAGGGTLIGGPQRASAQDLRVATTAARSFIAPVPGGYAILQPVALPGGRLAVTEVYVPAAEVSRGVTASWAVMTAAALLLIGVSVVVSDRLATRVTRPARELASAAATLGDGDLSARSTARGPAELAAAGRAFNVMAERLSRLIILERVMAADLPHRLRTPLTALRMNAAALGPGQVAADTRLAIDRLEQEIDLIIRRRHRRGERDGDGLRRRSRPEPERPDGHLRDRRRDRDRRPGRVRTGDQRRRRLVPGRGHPDDRRERHQRRDLHRGQRAATGGVRREQAPGLAVPVVGGPGHRVLRRRAELRLADVQQHRPDTGRVHGHVRRLLARRASRPGRPRCTGPGQADLDLGEPYLK
jgi:HAMP domain-containing protein